MSSRIYSPLQITPPIDSNMNSLDAILKKYTSEIENHLKGATFIAVDNQGNTLYSKSFGSRTFDKSKNEKLHLDSVHWIASLTKLVTGIACMIAVEKGLITLDQNVREIIPELRDIEQLLGFEDHKVGEISRKPIVTNVTAPITLRLLLSHQSGFAYDQLHPGLQEWSKYHGKKEWTMTGSMGGYNHPLVFQPGSGWVYGAGMDWAGRAVEIVSGMKLEDFMQTHIFSPLLMNSTSFHPELRPDMLARQMDLAWRDRAAGPSGALTHGKNPWGFPAKDDCGGVGLYSTPDDYAKLLKSLLANGGEILSKASVDQIMTSQLEDPKYFLDVLKGPAGGQLAQTWPKAAKATFGLTASINLEDFPGRRLAGSANWSGMPGLHAWVDRKTGVAGLLTTQVLPPGDPMVTKCFLELETALYAHLRPFPCANITLGG